MAKSLWRASQSNWLLWWRVDPDAVAWQAQNYTRLKWKFAQSARGRAVICLGIAITLMVGTVLLGRFIAANLLDPFLLLVLAVFIWFGHRWAIIGAMILWTLEKLMLALLGGVFVWASQALWWTVFMHFFYAALKVENFRRKMPMEPACPADEF